MATLMVEEHFSRVPIVDAAGKVVGIVTRSDLIAAMGREANRPTPSPADAPARRTRPVLPVTTLELVSV